MTRLWPRMLGLRLDIPRFSTTSVHPSRLPITWVSPRLRATIPQHALRDVIKPMVVRLSTCTSNETPLWTPTQ